MRTIAVVVTTIGLLLASGACKSKDEAKGGESPAAAPAAPEQVQKSPEDRLCEHMVTFVDQGKYTLAECTNDLVHAKADCAKWDAFIECALGAATEDALDACMDKCEGESAGTPAP